MNLVVPDTTYQAEQEAAEVAFNAAVRERSQVVEVEKGCESDKYQAAQAKVEAAYSEMIRYDVSYFRLNIWGMGKMRNSLVELGMAAHEYSMSEWPEADRFGFTQEQLWELVEEFEDNLEGAPEGYREWHAATAEYKRWSPPDEPGLPLHKFGSNDGWVVTPADCKSALALYDRAKEERPEVVEKVRAEWVQDSGENYFDEWIAYLERAVTHEGFEVW